jgi:hypothetical protein
MVMSSSLRFATGVCVLTAGLLIGAAGGAVAVADPDPDSTGSAAPGDVGTNIPGLGSSGTNNPVGTVSDTVRNTVSGATSGGTSGVTSTVGSGRQPGQQPSTGATSSPNNRPGGTATPDETNSPAPVSGALDSRPDVADPDPVAAVPNVGAPVADAAAPVTDVVAPVTDVVAPVTDVVAPVTDVVAPVTDVVAPVTDVVAPVTDVVAPVTDVVAPVTDVVAPVTDVIAVPVTDVVAPVTDVIAVPDMPTSVPGAAVPLTQLPSDPSSFLVGTAGVAPVVDGMGGTDGGVLGTAAGASLVSPLPLGPLVGGIPGVPLIGDATGVATLLRTTFEPTGVGRVSWPPGMAPLEPDGGIPMGLHSFFRDTYAKLLLPVSLWALFTVALPGAAGLVVLTAIGVRVGYRQAKAGLVVRAVGITRLARPGQLGVVRSGGSSAGSLDKVA